MARSLSSTAMTDIGPDANLTLKNRISYFFNNDLASDVRFLIQRESVPAHKFVLMANSSVFIAMFTGPMAEKGEVIKIEDCEVKEDFLQFLKYLYTENCNLTRKNVFSVLYFAKKYLVSPLIKLCTGFLSNRIGKNDVLLVLQQAIKFTENKLKGKCLQLIRPLAWEVISTDEFLSLDIETLKVILSQDQLNVSEVKLFRAVDLWCEKRLKEMDETKRTSETKRSILGDAVFLVRFPTMGSIEFADNCAYSGLLTSDECRDIFSWIARKDYRVDFAEEQCSVPVYDGCYSSPSIYPCFPTTTRRPCNYEVRSCKRCSFLYVDENENTRNSRKVYEICERCQNRNYVKCLQS